MSTLIRVITQICVESTAIVVLTNHSDLHTYPDATLIWRPHLFGCHTYPEAELFILWGTCKLKMVNLKSHSSSQCSWEPYKRNIKKNNSKNDNNKITVESCPRAPFHLQPKSLVSNAPSLSHPLSKSTSINLTFPLKYKTSRKKRKNK